MTGAVASAAGPASWPTCVGICLAATLAVACGLRLAFPVSALPITWDEPYMLPVLQAIWDQGWSVQTAIDYEDTKGPAFFWPYAWVGQVIHPSLATARWMTTILFVLTALPLAVVAHWLRLSPLGCAALAALASTLPYLGVLGQIFMSEPAFVLLLWAMAALALRGLGGPDAASPVSGPGAARYSWVNLVLFCLLLAITLHVRVHVVALAGAVALLALARLGWRSWPWLLGMLVAGLARLPLWLRWGGLVSPQWQPQYSLALRTEGVVYLAIAALPWTAALALWAAWRGGRTTWLMMGAAGLVGLMAALAAPLDLKARRADGLPELLGPSATVLTRLGERLPEGLPGLPMRLAVAIVAAGAFAAMAGAVRCAWPMPADRGPAQAPPVDPLAAQLAALTLILGWGLHILAAGDIYDRYVLSFACLMPLMWLRLPPALVAGQLALGVGQLALLGRNWLSLP